MRDIVPRISVVVSWSVLALLLYWAFFVPSALEEPCGLPLLSVTLEASALSLLFRRIIGAHAIAYRVPNIIFFAAFAGLSFYRLNLSIGARSLNMPHMFSLWGALAIALLMSALSLDGRQAKEFRSEERLTRVDILIAISLFALALALRVQGPVTGAVDEIIIFSEMLSLRRFPEIKFWDTSTSSNPYFVHWLVYLAAGQLKGLIDSFALEKLSSQFFASLSIVFWFLAVKFLYNRHIAVTAAALLAVFGWHWVNSRFIYIYPYELAAIALGTLCAVSAFGRGSFLAAAGLGLVWTFSILAKKISIMIVPFSAYLYIDFLLFRPNINRGRVCATFATALTVFIVSYAPFFLADGDLHRHIWGSERFFRYGQASEIRKARLAAMGLSPTGAYLHGFEDAAHQLFVRSSDAFRHYFRPAGPLLDPILAKSVLIGLAYAILLSFWERGCRVALMGLVVFTLPMVLSFPLDSQGMQGVARRMVGNTFFIVLLGALGVDLFSRAVAKFIPRWVLPAAVCIASAAFNLHYYKTEYLTQPSEVWFTDHGLRRAAAVQVARKFAQEGASVLILDHMTIGDQSAVTDLPNVRFFQSQLDLRAAITGIKSGKVLVIIPGRAEAYDFPVEAFAQDFGDIIPQSAWTPGPISPRGKPLIATAAFERRT